VVVQRERALSGPWYDNVWIVGIGSAVISSLITFVILRRFQRDPPSAEDIAAAEERRKHEREDREDDVAGRVEAALRKLHVVVSHDQAAIRSIVDVPEEGFGAEAVKLADEVRPLLSDVKAVLRRDDLAEDCERVLDEVRRGYEQAVAVVNEVRGTWSLINRDEGLHRARQGIAGLDYSLKRLAEAFGQLRPRRRPRS